MACPSGGNVVRHLILIVTSTAVLATLSSVIEPPPIRLLWNVSASVPTGLYALTDATHASLGDRVVLWPPQTMQALLAERGYLKSGTPLIKTVAAVGGQRVCRSKNRIIIDGNPAGTARKRDSEGRALPSWHGCQTLRADQLFVMNLATLDSFDGRYFGPAARSAIAARAVPLWTDERRDGRRVWFADPHHILPSSTTKGQ
jgi:conjugative transfer signal peptidase TraF